MTSFNERRGASSSEGGGEFEFRDLSDYLLYGFFFGGVQVAINTEQRKYIYVDT